VGKPSGSGAGESHDVDRPNVDVLPLWVATKIWFAISLQTFGGPAGQIAVMQRILVEEKRWIGQRRFLLALSYCTPLPGTEAQQLATYIGWLLKPSFSGSAPLSSPSSRRRCSRSASVA